MIGGGDWFEDRIIPDCIRSLEAGKAIGVERNPRAVRPWQFVLEPLGGYLLLGAVMGTDPDRYGGPWNFGPDRLFNGHRGRAYRLGRRRMGLRELGIDSDRSRDARGGPARPGYKQGAIHARLAAESHYRRCGRNDGRVVCRLREGCRRGAHMRKTDTSLHGANVPFMTPEEEQIRSEISGLVEKLYRMKYGRSDFVPGKTPVRYAGRVFDEREMKNLVDASLDFWLTAGRYAEESSRGSRNFSAFQTRSS